jgi:hypothetical protein
MRPGQLLVSLLETAPNKLFYKTTFSLSGYVRSRRRESGRRANGECVRRFFAELVVALTPVRSN